MRHGNIDALGSLLELDLLKLAESETQWPANFGQKPRYEALHFRRFIERWGFENLGRVADVACGSGLWSAFLAEVNDEVVGYDRNELSVAFGGSLAKTFGLTNLRFEPADITALPTLGGTFDGVWCQNVLNLTDRGRLLDEMNRVMRVGARAAILGYNCAGRVLDKFFIGFERGGITDPLAQFNLRTLENGPLHNGENNYGAPESISAVLEECGFALEGSPLVTGPTQESAQPDWEELRVLARRLQSDGAFCAEFVKNPDFAKTFPGNISFIAIKRHDLGTLAAAKRGKTKSPVEDRAAG
ncbi:MAG: class I SAM-dependent methyltransferase [Caulobacteraceae bacterium]